jgi:hypothetical protein
MARQQSQPNPWLLSARTGVQENSAQKFEPGRAGCCVYERDPMMLTYLPRSSDGFAAQVVQCCSCLALVA